MEKQEKPRDPVARLDEIVAEITTLYAEADKLIDQYVIRLYREPTTNPHELEKPVRGGSPSPLCGLGQSG